MAKAKAKAKNPLGIAPFDPVDYLTSERHIAEYLKAVLEEAPDDPEFILRSLNVVARARGILRLAKDTGMTRAGLYKALSPEGNPSFATVIKIMTAFGVRLSAQVA